MYNSFTIISFISPPLLYLVNINEVSTHQLLVTEQNHGFHQKVFNRQAPDFMPIVSCPTMYHTYVNRKDTVTQNS